MLEKRLLTVKEVNKYVKKLLEEDVQLVNIWVKGEISNFKHHTSGHSYLTLKDSSSALKCVMFRSRNRNLTFCPEDGMEVMARGYISVYERMGQFQLYIEEMEPSGVGSLHIAYEQLKEKLKNEGLFDEKVKKPLPFMPATIALITSKTGAAARDVLNILERRFPGLDILFVPTQVQGKGASAEIVESLELVNKNAKADIILLVRGGGSIEDLWSFNTEEVARAVAASSVPVIAGIGHETDFTIADFVADKRAPTPSAAAEIAVPVKAELSIYIEKLKRNLSYHILRHLKERRDKLQKISSSKIFLQPGSLFDQHRQNLDTLDQRLRRNMNDIYRNNKQKYLNISGKLEVLSPLKILARGYSICRRDLKIVRDVRDIDLGDEVEVILRKGSLVCSVEQKRGDLAWKREKKS